MKLLRHLRWLNSGLLLALVIIGHYSFAQTITLNLTPSKDNTMFSESNAESNGKGYEIYVGRTVRFSTVRRGLIQFDFSSLPSNAIILNARLECAVTRKSPQVSNPVPVFLYRLTNTWGEGTSVAGLGNGVPATTNDATWTYNFYSISSWNTPGGDFVNACSDTALAVLNDYAVWDGPGLKSDIGYWRTNPSNNFGWIILGDELLPGSAIGLSSRESPVVPKPQLIIEYTIPPEEKLILNELNPTNKWVEIYNAGTNTVNLDTYYLKNNLGSVAISSPSVVLKMGSKQLASHEYAILGLSSLNSNLDFLSLYQGNPTSSGQIKDFVQYGQSFISEAILAVSAGVWDNSNSFLTAITQNLQTFSINGNLSPGSGSETSSVSWLSRSQTPQYKNLDCPNTSKLNGVFIENNYKSSNTIQIQGNIENPSRMIFNSEKSISILPNFSSEIGATFELKVGACN